MMDESGVGVVSPNLREGGWQEEGDTKILAKKCVTLFVFLVVFCLEVRHKQFTQGVNS